MVREKTTDTVYAMKVLRKSDLLSQPDVSKWMRDVGQLVGWLVCYALAKVLQYYTWKPVISSQWMLSFNILSSGAR